MIGQKAPKDKQEQRQIIDQLAFDPDHLWPLTLIF